MLICYHNGAMKKLIIYLILVSSLFACKKEDNICKNPPEGWYEGWFTYTDSGETDYQPIMNVKIINDTTIKILWSTNSADYYSVNRNGCSLSGKIGVGIGNNVMNIDGILSHEDGLVTIRGDYILKGHSGGLGNPNPQWFEIPGTFIIKQQNITHLK